MGGNIQRMATIHATWSVLRFAGVRRDDRMLTPAASVRRYAERLGQPQTAVKASIGGDPTIDRLIEIPLEQSKC